MKELGDLVSRFDAQLSGWRDFSMDSFSLENGFVQLKNHFSEITLYRYTDSLIVTDARMLTDYILSGRVELPPERQLELASFVEQELRENHGSLFISKDSGVFDCW